jgi:drug/metabolite transporter (DMT)-like permease
MTHITSRRTRRYALALYAVVLIWGLDPLIMSYFYRYYSASVLTAIGTLISTLLFLFLCRRRLKLLTKRLLLVAFPIGVLNAVACLLQKIGLQYTTPANYAFLEHISCLVVPLTLFFLIRRRPSPIQCFSGAVCLIGCFLLCGVRLGGGTLAVGDLLCMLAGILLGVCVALTGVFAKELDMMLYMLVNMGTYFLASLASALLLDRICVGGMPLEALRFTSNPRLLVLAVLFGLVSIGLCWLLKNLAIVHTDPTAVAIVSPFSAVIAAVFSVLLGQDHLSARLVGGAMLILLAVVLSGMNTAAEERREHLRNI